MDSVSRRRCDCRRGRKSSGRPGAPATMSRGKSRFRPRLVDVGNRPATAFFLTSVIAAEKGRSTQEGVVFWRKPRDAAPAGEHRWMVYCVDWKTGKLLWEREVHHGKAPARHLKNSYASGGRRLQMASGCTLFGSVGVFCLDLDGKFVWSQPFEPYRTRYGWGTASCPALHKASTSSTTTRINRSWRHWMPRPANRSGAWRATNERSNWASPYIWESGKRTEIVTAAERDGCAPTISMAKVLGSWAACPRSRFPHLFPARFALRHIRLCRRSGQTGIRGTPRSFRRHQPQG